MLFKDDGSVCVHALKGAKPINYMPGPTIVEEADDLIRVRRPSSGETLTILLLEHATPTTGTSSSTTRIFERQGREKEIQALLARAPHVIEPGLVLVERERPTDVGPVDLFCRDRDGRGDAGRGEARARRRGGRRAGDPVPRAGRADARRWRRPARSWPPPTSRRRRACWPTRAASSAWCSTPRVLRGASDPDLTLF